MYRSYVVHVRYIYRVAPELAAISLVSGSLTHICTCKCKHQLPLVNSSFMLNKLLIGEKKMKSTKKRFSQADDRRTFMKIIAFVYSPLALLPVAALVI